MNIIIGLVIVLLIVMAFGNHSDIVEKRQQESRGERVPTEAGSINCSLDRRHCTPGQRQ